MTTTTLPTLEDLMATFAQVRVPDGKGSTEQPCACDIADVIAAMKKAGWFYAVVAGSNIWYASFWRLDRKQKGGIFKRDAAIVDPANADSLRRAVLSAAVEAARARGALPKEAVDA